MSSGELRSNVTHASLSIDNRTIEKMASAAWQVRDLARVQGDTKVGCAAIDSVGEIFTGCNVEHRYRSHDIHAEVNAISSLVAGSSGALVATLIVARRDRFTPCGACLDWIFELGGEDCVVMCQAEPGGRIVRQRGSELMPYYPR
jgi:cytidine deaminase